MVLPLLISILICPGLLGTQESIRQSQQKEKREEHRARRCNLIASCVKSSLRSREIDGRPIVLRDGKLYIDTGTSNGEPFGHQYAGYYLPYPDTKYEGLVTTITDVAPIMNWVYVDKETYEVKYGVRLEALPNLTGPFDCTRQDRRLTFEGWEGFCAVEEYPTIWALYVDRDDDGLRSKLPLGTRVLEIELTRKEKRWKKEPTARKEDQGTERAVNAQGQTPIETQAAQQSSPNSTDSTKDASDSKNTYPTDADARSSEHRNTTDAPPSTQATPTGTQPYPTESEASQPAIAQEPLSNPPTVHPNADAPPAYSEQPDSTSSPTNTHGGSEWSGYSDDITMSRSLAGFTPASSTHGDDVTLHEQTALDQPANSAPESSAPGSPHSHVSKSPPSLPVIPEENRTNIAKDTSRIRSYSTSSKIIDKPHPLSHQSLSRPATAAGTSSTTSSTQSPEKPHSFRVSQNMPSPGIPNPSSPTGSPPFSSEGAKQATEDGQIKALEGEHVKGTSGISQVRTHIDDVGITPVLTETAPETSEQGTYRKPYIEDEADSGD